MTDILQQFRRRPIFEEDHTYAYSISNQNGETIIENYGNVEELDINTILLKINNKHNQIDENRLIPNKKIIIQLKKTNF